VIKLATLPSRQRIVSIGAVRTIYACAFSEPGWHPIVETLKELECHPSINFRDTTLYRFHKAFTPRNILELLNVDNRKINTFEFPWGYFSPYGPTELKSVNRSRFCGPSSEKFIQDEFLSIRSLFARIKKEGYRPWTAGNDFIYGTHLISKGGDHRFVVLQGNHRLACLAHLGIERIAVRTSPVLLREVRQGQLESWPAVVENRCSRVDAERCFQLYFTQNGSHVQARLKSRTSTAS